MRGLEYSDRQLGNDSDVSCLTRSPGSSGPRSRRSVGRTSHTGVRRSTTRTPRNRPVVGIRRSAAGGFRIMVDPAGWHLSQRFGQRRHEHDTGRATAIYSGKRARTGSGSSGSPELHLTTYDEHIRGNPYLSGILLSRRRGRFASACRVVRTDHAAIQLRGSFTHSPTGYHCRRQRRIRLEYADADQDLVEGSGSLDFRRHEGEMYRRRPPDMRQEQGAATDDTDHTIERPRRADLAFLPRSGLADYMSRRMSTAGATKPWRCLSARLRCFDPGHSPVLS